MKMNAIAWGVFYQAGNFTQTESIQEAGGSVN